MTTSRINSESVIGVLRAGTLTASQVAAELHTSTEVVQLSQHRHSPNVRRNREQRLTVPVLRKAALRGRGNRSGRMVVCRVSNAGLHFAGSGGAHVYRIGDC
ncbi:hypothetical protein L0Y93_06005 [Burkholderia multivorans]|nr:hypothetical protein [Burkholderia multivorans]MCO1461175.1 hypothetical protein [Burkholderia multivorans]